MTPEEHAEACQRTIDECNAMINDRMAVRKAAERRLFWCQQAANADAGISLVIMAARHLDPAEGVMQAGHVVTGTDIAAVRTVLRFVSAHRDCEVA